MADNLLVQLVLRAKDAASKTVDKVRGSVRGLGDSADKAAGSTQKVATATDNVGSSLSRNDGFLAGAKARYAAIGLAAGAAVAAIGRLAAKAGEWIRAANIQERAETKLATTLRNLVGATDAEIQALKDQASALQLVTGYGDEATISAQAMLGTFRLTSEQIGQLTPRLLDMAESARKAGQSEADLEQISIAVGKAFSDGLGSLKRYGVALSEAQEEEFKLADQAEKVRILTEVLDGNFKGLAVAVGDTYEGALRKAQAAQGDLNEVLGQSFTQNRDFLTLQNLITESWVQFAEGVKGSAKDIGESISALSRGVKVTFGAIRAIWNEAQIGFKSLQLVISFGAEKINRALASITFGDMSKGYTEAADRIAKDNKALIASIAQDATEVAAAGRTILDGLEGAGDGAAAAKPKVDGLNNGLNDTGTAAAKAGEALKVVAAQARQVDRELSLLGVTADSLASGLTNRSGKALAAFNRLMVEGGDNSTALVRGIQKATESVDDLSVLEAMALQVAAAVDAGRLSDKEAAVAKQVLAQRGRELYKELLALGVETSAAAEMTEGLTSALNSLPGSVNTKINIDFNDVNNATTAVDALIEKNKQLAAEQNKAMRDKEAAKESAEKAAEAQEKENKELGSAVNLTAIVRQNYYDLSQAAGEYFDEKMRGVRTIKEWWTVLSDNEFNRVKEKYEDLHNSVDALTDRIRIGAATQTEMAVAANHSAGAAKELGEERLATLRSALADAKSRSDALSDSAQAALQRYQDEADPEGAAARRLVREKTELEEKYQEAVRTGNIEAQRLLKEAIEFQRQAHTEAMQQIETEGDTWRKRFLPISPGDPGQTPSPQGTQQPIDGWTPPGPSTTLPAGHQQPTDDVLRRLEEIRGHLGPLRDPGIAKSAGPVREETILEMDGEVVGRLVTNRQRRSGTFLAEITDASIALGHRI